MAIGCHCITRLALTAIAGIYPRNIGYQTFSPVRIISAISKKAVWLRLTDQHHQNPKELRSLVYRRNQIRCQFVGSINNPLIENPLKNKSFCSSTKSVGSYPEKVPRFSNTAIAGCIQTSSLWHLKHPTKLGCVVGGPLGSRSG
jgi:hypothetical protein